MPGFFLIGHNWIKLSWRSISSRAAFTTVTFPGPTLFGIPLLLFFLITFIGQMVINFREGRRFKTEDPVASDLHTLIFANLAALGASIYIGADLNLPIIWFYLVMGVLLTRLKAADSSPIEGIPEERAAPHFRRFIAVER